MKRIIKCICALLCLMFLCTSALADTAGLDWAAGSYLDGYEDVQFHMTAQIESLTPYGDGTLEMMNALLKNMSVGAKITDTATEMQFCVAGDPVVTLAEISTPDGIEMTTSLLPNRTLVSSDSGMDMLSGFEQEETKFDLLAAIQEAEACYQELAEAIIPFAEEKSASYSIKNVGSARWVRLARMTPEQSAQIQPQIAKLLGCGMDAAFREQLNGMTCQKSFTVALYSAKEGGKDLAMYIKGNVLFPDGKQRAISYQWAFAENDKNQRIDTYKFDMTKESSPRDNRQISGSYKRSAKADSLLMDGTIKAVIRDPETNITTTTTITHDLSGKGGAVEGTISRAVRTAQGETARTKTVTFAPKLQFTEAEGVAALTGSIHVEQLAGQTVHTSLDLLFDEQSAYETLSDAEDGVMFMVIDERLPQSSLTQNLDFGKDEPEDYLVGKPPIGYTAYAVPEEEIILDLDAISAEENAALLDEMTQRLAGHLLTAIAKLPDEATALIRDNLSEADYAAFLDLLDE